MKFSKVGLFDRLKRWLTKTYCPVCNSKNAGFSPLSDFYRNSAEQYGYVHFGKGEMTALDTYSCTQCGASDRERLYAYWLASCYAAPGEASGGKAIHFAPEARLSASVQRQAIFSHYQTADLMMQGVDHTVDLLNLPFAEHSYDFFICSHVLEHVDDDRAAIRELFRITSQSGGGILMAPIIMGLPETIEDPSITDEGERWRLFGQNDHVRLYSHDGFVSRIKESGFLVHELDQAFFGARLFRQLGLKPSSILYVVTKS
ncbi:methyltransferase domain-containing protein [Pseudomonas sp. CCOS 191]|uniref:methyltransferase domain-containing protein n=1 Tax=Pseudomonas sp. CCOS 191 TaxID=1649877 RepID=UPI000624B81C|nr:methyltransferase domain-containing protein [Pseudomonas sp. CCOS 191]CRI59811.1 methyltransferase type 12 [Pseudomonas sp. CCOS 191]